jgi:hypothetical protein
MTFFFSYVLSVCTTVSVSKCYTVTISIKIVCPMWIQLFSAILHQQISGRLTLQPFQIISEGILY